MNDIDYIFTELYGTNEKLYNLETSHLTEEYNYMIKLLEYTLTVDAGVITVTPPVNTSISQYQEIVVRATVVGLTGIKKTVKLSISTPAFSTSVDETIPTDFEHTVHLIPTSYGTQTFEVRLNEFLGTGLAIGQLNQCPILFSIIDESDNEYLGDLENSISLYRTNTDVTYAPDDISSLFIKISELEQRMAVIESEGA